jgi:hypothetical protein
MNSKAPGVVFTTPGFVSQFTESANPPAPAAIQATQRFSD